MAANAIRLSALLAIVVGALYAQGLYLALRSGAGGLWPVLAIGVLVPLVPGVLALMGRMPSLLLLAWGWVLGVHLPKMLAILLAPTPMPIDRSAVVIVSLAAAGTALYLYGAVKADR